MTSKLKCMDKKPWNSKFDLTGPLNDSLSWNRAMAINICSFVSCSLLFIILMCWLFLVRLNRNFCGSKRMSGSPSPGDLHPQNSCSVHWSLTLCNPRNPWNRSYWQKHLHHLPRKSDASCYMKNVAFSSKH